MIYVMNNVWLHRNLPPSLYICIYLLNLLAVMNPFHNSGMFTFWVPNRAKMAWVAFTALFNLHNMLPSSQVWWQSSKEHLAASSGKYRTMWNKHSEKVKKLSVKIRLTLCLLWMANTFGKHFKTFQRYCFFILSFNWQFGLHPCSVIFMFLEVMVTIFILINTKHTWLDNNGSLTAISDD